VRAGATVSVVRGSTLANGITMVPVGMRLLVGDSARVTTTVLLTSTAPAGTSRAVTYESADPAIAVVSPDGVVRGVGPGSTVVIASAVAAPRLQAQVVVTVLVPAP
jgi:uncharacterized protein YjdB